MQNKPIIKQSLSDKADQRERETSGRSFATAAGWLVGIGIVVSALLTITYLMLLVEEAAGLPSPYGYLFGLLVGVVAVVPAELALVIWRSRLESDGAITDGQRNTAVTAIILAGVFSALTTSSFFSYFLPQLFPPSYLAIAPTLNIGAIVGSWVVFLIAIVAYSVFSRQTQQNLAQAKANQGIFDARMDVLRSAGEAIRSEAENWVSLMDQNGVFSEDARRLIIAALGMEDDRLNIPRTQLPAPQPAFSKNGTPTKVEQTAPAALPESDTADYDKYFALQKLLEDAADAAGVTPDQMLSRLHSERIDRETVASNGRPTPPGRND